jgi:hypothetical protein
MSEETIFYAWIGVSAALITLLTILEALGVKRLPLGGSQIAQVAIVFVTPLAITGLFFAAKNLFEVLGLT